MSEYLEWFGDGSFDFDTKVFEIIDNSMVLKILLVKASIFKGHIIYESFKGYCISKLAHDLRNKSYLILLNFKYFVVSLRNEY